MRDPLQVLDYDHWWRKDLNNILPFTFPAVTEDIIDKMELQIEDSSNRIHNTRDNGDAIVSHLQALVNELKTERVFPFQWGLKLYKAPPKKANKEFEFTADQLALIESVAMDNAIKRTLNLEPCVIYTKIASLETSHYCIVKCKSNSNYPFFVCEVISNNKDNNTLTVQWWAPNAISTNKGGKYHSMSFEAQTTKHRITNRQKGAPYWRLKPQTDDIAYNTVYFGFSKLTRDRRLPAEVLRKLRGLALISKNIKIKRF